MESFTLNKMLLPQLENVHSHHININEDTGLNNMASKRWCTAA
jgi:hypothetical protein